MAKSDSIDEPKRRGRPTAKWLTLAELAERLDCHEGALERCLEQLGGLAFPGALKDDVKGWEVPESALVKVLGTARPFFSIPEFAKLFGVSKFTISRACTAGRIKVVKIPELGVQRIPWSEYQRIGRLKGGSAA